MQARYIFGAALVFAAVAMSAVASYFTSQVAYFTVDELFERPGLVPEVLGETSSGSVSGLPPEPPLGSPPGSPLGSPPGLAEKAVHDGGVAVAAEAVVNGPRYQVRGSLDLATLERPGEGLGMRFELFGKSGRLPVAYQGVVPDTFERAEAVTVGGRFAADGTFVADELLVQCPSKYEAKLGTATPGTQLDTNG